MNTHREGRLLSSTPPGATLVPPMRTGSKLTPHDFDGMFPARFVPDYYMNQAEGGVYYDITPFAHPLLVPAGGIATPAIVQTIFEISHKFDEFVVQTYCQTEEIIAGVLQPPSRSLPIDCLRRDLGAQEQLDDDYVSIYSVFGTGRYPHPMAMPLVLSSNSSFQIELRNRGANPVRVWLVLGAMEKNATREMLLPH